MITKRYSYKIQLAKIQQGHIGDWFVKFVYSRKVRGFGMQTVPRVNESNAEKVASIKSEVSLFV